MSEPVLIERDTSLEVQSRMQPGMRIALALLGLFPLIAPYELLLQIDWQEYLHPFFLLAALISAGAIALSLFLFYAAAAGISSRLVFDRSAAKLTYSFEAPIVRRKSRVYPLASISSIEVAEREWSEGSPTYHLRILIEDGTEIESGSSWSRADVESICERVRAFLGGDAVSQAAVA